MDFTGILKNIAKHITLEEKEISTFTSLLTYRKVLKKEKLLGANEICSAINYVQTGALRAYYNDTEGNENIIMFATSDWWVTDMYSFTSEKPAMLNIDALEDSTIFQLQKSDLDKLYIDVPKFERFFRIIIQNAYIREQLRVIQNLSMSAEERYASFLLKYPQFVERIPLKQIASYLGITPEFLSVLRKKKSKT
jgi:CRP-like cAMP-binding protein